MNAEVLDPKEVLSNNVYELDQGRFVTHEAGSGLAKQFVGGVEDIVGVSCGISYGTSLLMGYSIVWSAAV